MIFNETIKRGREQNEKIGRTLTARTPLIKGRKILGMSYTELKVSNR